MTGDPSMHFPLNSQLLFCSLWAHAHLVGVFSAPTGFQLNTPLPTFKLSICGPSPGCEVSRAHGVVRYQDAMLKEGFSS